MVSRFGLERHTVREREKERAKGACAVKEREGVAVNQAELPVRNAKRAWLYIYVYAALRLCFVFCFSSQLANFVHVVTISTHPMC